MGLIHVAIFELRRYGELSQSAVVRAKKGQKEGFEECEREKREGIRRHSAEPLRPVSIRLATTTSVRNSDGCFSSDTHLKLPTIFSKLSDRCFLHSQSRR